MGRPAFPRSIVEFQHRFPDDEACREYLFASRWPEGFRCPRCMSETATALSTRLVWQCPVCRYQVSVTAGTVLHRARAPLHVWFWAACLVATATPGFSALQLQRQLGLSRYETAWMMLQKLRRAMVNPEREPLADAIEVDEGFPGGHAEGLRGGREHGGKTLVVIAVEVRGAGCGRARMKLIGDAAADTLCGFVAAIARPGTTVHTDGWQGYKRLSRLGYDHQPRSQQRHRSLGGGPDEILPRVHRVISNLKTWLQGTRHGVSPGHLPVYLDEFVFRFNRRRTPMAAFQTLLGLGSQQQPTTYQQITARGSRARKHLAESTG
jgi:transposase-like protein